VHGAVERNVVEIEADDPVECCERFVLELLEDTGGDPLVASSARGRVRRSVLEDRLDVDPRGTGHESDQDASEAQPRA
jgi:hypothetical protein